jgi:hypothetical protein
MPSREFRVPSRRARIPVLAGLLVALLIGPLWSPVAGAGANAQTQPRCDAERLGDRLDLTPVRRSHLRRMQRKIDAAVGLFRLHRVEEALAKLDSSLALLDSSPSATTAHKRRSELRGAILSLRNCLVNTEPPAMATLTIQTSVPDDTTPAGEGTSAGGRAYIDMGAIRLGRTDERGTLTLQAPSGEIRLTATIPPSSWGEAFVRLAPDEVASASLVLDDSKEPSEDTDLVMVEVVDGILPAGGTSLTMRFMRDDELAAVTDVDHVELLDRDGGLVAMAEELFAVVDGAVSATDPAALYELIARYSAEHPALQLRAQATDADGLTHSDSVLFYVGRYRLGVALEPPPSNPALPVSQIDVGVSVVGTDVTIRRHSDAEGRFDIDWLPSATLKFDAVTVADGLYYYADAILVHTADCSVKVVLRHVADLVNNVPGLTRDGCPPAPPLPRKP